MAAMACVRRLVNRISIRRNRTGISVERIQSAEAQLSFLLS